MLIGSISFEDELFVRAVVGGAVVAGAAVVAVVLVDLVGVVAVVADDVVSAKRIVDETMNYYHYHCQWRLNCDCCVKNGGFRVRN